MFYDRLDTGTIGPLTLIADHEGLRHIVFASARNPIALEADWIHNPTFFKEIKGQLRAYFDGRLTHFDLPLSIQGTDFQKKVWQALGTIAYGTTVSYGWVARQIGNPKAVRAVGAANAKNPLPIVIPCHRVIGHNGALTGFGGGLDVKQKLIELEILF